MIDKNIAVTIGNSDYIWRRVKLSQYDTDWRFNFTVYEGNEVYNIPAGSVAVLNGKKKDGTVFTYSGSILNNIVTVVCDKQISSSAGDVECELRISSGGRIVGSANFIFDVEASPISGFVLSESDFSALDQITNRALESASYIGTVEEALEYVKSAVGSPLVANTASDMTDTDKVYVYTGSEDGYTEGDWYYYDGSAWTSGGVYNAVAINTDTTLSVANMAADAKACGDLKSAVSEKTQNLWLWGDQTVTGTKRVVADANLPAGTYTMSALVTKNESGNVRMVFYKNTTAPADLLANPYIAANSRNSTTFTLGDTCNVIMVYSAANSTGSIEATWHDVQIESGSTATAYIPPITATDYKARLAVAAAQTAADAAQEDADEALRRLEKQILISQETYTDADSFSFTLPDYNAYRETPIISCDAMFTRDAGVTDYPRLCISVPNNRDLERNTTFYMIGAENEYQIREWRAPAYIWEDKTVTISVVVPSGCTLSIRKMWYRFDSSIDRTVAYGTKFFARAGTCNMVPELTMPAMQMANRHGYDTFTVIPKVSSDGVWFAYHDDKWDINTTMLRNADGTTITDQTYNGDYFHEIPFSYLNQFGYGSYGTMFRGTKLLKLEDCFAFLAKTGMKLRFSMHPATGINTLTKLADLKRLVQKYGLLKDLTIIVNDITSLFPVFGNDIGGYCFGNSTEASWTGDTNRVDKGFTAAQDAKTNYNITVPINCGLWSDSLFANRANAEALVTQILDAGFTAGVFTYTFTGIDGSSHSYLWSEDMRWLMSIGVTEFTDGYNTSIGLNW